MDQLNAWLYGIDPLVWVALLTVAGFVLVGWQLNRIERQNEGLYDILKKKAD